MPAGGWHLLDNVFGVAGVSPTELATTTLAVTTAGAPVWAYASVVDNGNGDPTTIPMLVLSN